MTLLVDSMICDKRLMARDLARRSSDDFRDTYGHSPLDSVAPFQKDEIILGRRVGAGSFSNVYDIQDFDLSPKSSKKYPREQVKKREAIAKSVKSGAKYVMKCLKDKLEASDDEELFPCAAQDITFEAELLAALSHPNIIKLHGVVDSRHDAFREGASEYFIILEKLDCTLEDKIEGWSKKSFNPSRSLKSLKSSFSSRAVDKLEAENSATTSTGEGRSLHSRLGVAASLASAVDCLHKQGVIFRDIKPDNVGFDRHGNLKLFDFGLARFMPKHGDAYDDVHEMTGLGTPRYAAPEVIFHHPYNLKADIYSFSVVLWEIFSLKKPFAQYKERKDLERALSKVDRKTLAINRKWPQPIQDIIKSGSARDLWDRPKMSEVCKILNECTSNGLECCDNASSVRSGDSRRSKCLVLPSPRRLQKTLSHGRSLAKKKTLRQLSEATTVDTSCEEFFSREGLEE